MSVVSKTLPSRSRPNKQHPCTSSGSFPTCPKLDKVEPRHLVDPIQYHAYFIQDSLDSHWTKELMDLLENTYEYQCSEYNRDFVIGEKVLDLMTSFIFTSDKIVMVLSENFLSSRMAMHQLQLAVRYDIDHDKSNIIVLRIDECEVPSQLLLFDCIATNEETWFEKFVVCLGKPSPPMLKEICTNGTHVSVDEICKTQRSVMSDPPTLKPGRNGLCIPDNIRQQIKIWHRSRSIDESQQNKSAPVKGNTGNAENSTEQEPEEVTKGTKTVEYSIEDIRPHQATLMHTLKMRIEGTRVFEASQTRIKQNECELTVHEGDVLEILHETPLHGNMFECENAQGQIGLVPRGILSPSWHLLPSSIVKLMQQPISSKENGNFEGELIQLGLSYYTAIEKHEKARRDTMHLSVGKGDVLFRLSDVSGGRAKFKNCRNETGYLGMSYVKEVKVESTVVLNRSSIGSEGYGSETEYNSVV